MNGRTQAMYRNWHDMPFANVPKGQPLISIRINPWNGWLNISYADTPTGMHMIDVVLDQITGTMRHISIVNGTKPSFADYVRYCDGDMVFEDIADCPICGNPPTIDRNYGGDMWYAGCYSDGCLVHLGPFESKAQARDAWNRLVTPARWKTAGGM